MEEAREQREELQAKREHNPKKKHQRGPQRSEESGAISAAVRAEPQDKPHKLRLKVMERRERIPSRFKVPIRGERNNYRTLRIQQIRALVANLAESQRKFWGS